MKDTTDREIQALVSMIDEPDADVFSEISEKIVHCGESAIPFLDARLDDLYDQDIRSRVESLIRRIRYNTMVEELTAFYTNNNNKELLQVWLILSRYHYPDMDEAFIDNQISSITRDIWLELNENLTVLEKIRVFNQIFYDVYGFKGNMQDYHDPENSFINRVLYTRKGNPLSLGLLYMLIANRLDLPVLGINLPEHFVLAYLGESVDPENMRITRDVPLFYINAFSSGAVFSIQEINEFLDKLDMEPLPAFFEPCNPKDIILRMLNNLVAAFDTAGNLDRKAELEALREYLEQL
ncbi:MAG: transglutaminase-like domain-containing protein [Bacteroidales bacterium]